MNIGRKILVLALILMASIFAIIFYLDQRGQQLVTFSNNDFSILHPGELSPKETDAAGIIFFSNDASGLIKQLAVSSNRSENSSTMESVIRRLERQIPSGQKDDAVLGRKKIGNRETVIFKPIPSKYRDSITTTAYIVEESTVWSIKFTFKEDIVENDQILEEIVGSFDAAK